MVVHVAFSLGCGCGVGEKVVDMWEKPCGRPIEGDCSR